jgi:alkanesulfonate monooxygenase SsuD/methylene tetrahydromethanopterin reductase-like flavin-dependent oxidoreductase (luciferase family)
MSVAPLPPWIGSAGSMTSRSLRVLTRIGGAVDGVEPATTLHGNAGTIIEQVERYADAGVHHLVIEPFSNDLQDFLEQLQLFAED